MRLLLTQLFRRTLHMTKQESNEARARNDAHVHIYKSEYKSNVFWLKQGQDISNLKLSNARVNDKEIY